MRLALRLESTAAVGDAASGVELSLIRGDPGIHKLAEKPTASRGCFGHARCA